MVWETRWRGDSKAAKDTPFRTWDLGIKSDNDEGIDNSNIGDEDDNDVSPATSANCMTSYQRQLPLTWRHRTGQTLEVVVRLRPLPKIFPWTARLPQVLLVESTCGSSPAPPEVFQSFYLFYFYFSLWRDHITPSVIIFPMAPLFILFIISLSDLGTYKYPYLTGSLPSCSLWTSCQVGYIVLVIIVYILTLDFLSAIWGSVATSNHFIFLAHFRFWPGSRPYSRTRWTKRRPNFR